MPDAVDSPAAAVPRPRVAIRFGLGAGVALLAICAALWLAGLSTRGWFAWPRFQDDAYYYLVIAQNAAAGHGFTMDRLSPTNGFQPLWQWLLIPLAWLCQGRPELFLGSVQFLSVLCFAAGGGALCGLARAQLGLVPALVAGFLLLLPRFLNIAVSGMESALVLMLIVLVLREALRGAAFFTLEPRPGDARLGALLGLLMLARLDSVFIPFVLVADLALRGLASEGTALLRVRRVVAKGLSVFWPALALLVPYLVWNQLAFGRMMPISGALKTSFPVPGFSPEHLRIEYLGLIAIAFLGVASERAAGRRGDPLVRLLGLLALALSLHALFTVVFMRWAVFAWHFVTFVPIGALGSALLARNLAVHLPRPVIGFGLFCLVAFQLFAQTLSISRLSRTFTVAGREAGAWVAANLPADALMGMKDSGIFTFYAERRVVNLDGVANNFEYQRVLCSGGLARYLRQLGVGYIAQHSVPAHVRVGAYEVFVQAYPCHTDGGRDGELRLRRDLEIYRGTPYSNDAGRLDQLFVWRLAPAD